VTPQPRRELKPLADALTELRLQRGLPTYREIAAATGMSHSAVQHICTGQSCSSWKRVERITLYLDGDPKQIQKLWIAARREIWAVSR